MAASSGPSYFETLTAAINDLAEYGYDSQSRIDYWAEQIRLAAERSLKSPDEIDRMMRDAMAAVYRKAVDQGGALKFHPGVSRFTLERIRPQLHDELRRRIAANADLIKRNRAEAIEKTQRRFRAWGTSIPAGGSDRIDRREEKTVLRKALASLPHHDRAVIIDQTAKLNAAISATIALNGDALGAIWHSHKHQAGYDGRPDHNARDGKFFLVKGSWADQRGLVKPGPNGYVDGIEQPAELPFCRCHWQWIYALRSIPDDCMTDKGRETLRAARAALAAG